MAMTFTLKNGKRKFHMGMASKLSLAIAAIILILFTSSVISILEFRRMSTYVSDRISDNITCINLSSEFAVSLDEYNLRILSSVGKADSLKISDINPKVYLSVTDSLLFLLSEHRLVYADSLYAAYERYVARSLELNAVIVSDFMDTRDWYFTKLQPEYNNVRKYQDILNLGIHDNLMKNSVSFDESFYRSIMPSVVSVAVGILLSLLLLFFILAYYVHPLDTMLRAMDSHKRYSHQYNVLFEGDDQLQELNADISELISENAILKKKIRERER